MASKMYVAIGLDKDQQEMFCTPNGSHPKNSPYARTALVIFAHSDEQAAKRAKKRLGNVPMVVKQVGNVGIDLRGQEFHHNTETKVDEFWLGDYNDTREGLLVHAEMRAKAAKAGK